MSRQTSSASSSWAFAEDLYETLGVSETASPADIRRAYRLLALAWHPDRAGPRGGEQFVRIAAAYGVLANPTKRADYDAGRRQRAEVAAAAARGTRYEIRIGHDGRPIARVRGARDRLSRISGPIDHLSASGVARVRADGTVDLFLTGDEIAAGGTAVIDMALAVSCSTCGGISRPHGVWCRRCEYAGVVVESVTIHVPVLADVALGSEYRIAARAVGGIARPLVFRFHRQAASPSVGQQPRSK